MDSFEFLGGRYNRPEQIMSGRVQAFRAQNAATGQTVFIHRISTAEAPEEQASLLKLLTTALVKSSEAKQRVLDFGEERGYWYVVTQDEPQCALLREWLQLEIEAASGNGRPASKPSSAPPPVPPASAKQDQTDPGEFTRFLKARPPLNAETAASPARPVPPPQTPPETPRPSEFTSFFNATDAERRQARNPPAPAPPPRSFTPPPPASPLPDSGPAQQEPGEFTRFFKAGPPALPSKPAPPVPPAINERTQNNPFVQRPHTPVNLPTVPPQKPAERGEFTQLFSRPDNAMAPAKPPAANYHPPPPVRSDPFGFAKQPTGQPSDIADKLFDDRIDIPRPLPASQPKQGEFTRMFGGAGTAPPPVQPQSVVAQPRENPLLDETKKEEPARATQPFSLPKPPVSPSAEEPPGSSPSEFTRIMQGGYGPAKQGPATAAGPAAGGSSSPLLNVNVSPVNPLAALPRASAAAGSLGAVHGQASAHGASLGTPLGSANLQGPHLPGAHLQAPPANLALNAPTGAANKKMVILFSVIGVLAVLLILLTLFLIKK